MSVITKAIDRLKRKPTDFKWSELTRIMNHFGYQTLEGSGSRVKFYHPEKDSIVNLHRPHNPKTLRKYQIEDVLNQLGEDGFV